jgi:hypothetical protein
MSLINLNFNQSTFSKTIKSFLSLSAGSNIDSVLNIGGLSYSSDSVGFDSSLQRISFLKSGRYEILFSSFVVPALA